MPWDPKRWDLSNMTETALAKLDTYTSGKIDRFSHDSLKASEEKLGQLYPVLKNANGIIIDGFHRTRVNPNWKSVTLPVKDELETLRLRVHVNLMRRAVEAGEKAKWIMEAREILKSRELKGTQKQIAKALGLDQQWVSKWDPIQHQEHPSKSTTPLYFQYNVWGFKDDSWRSLVRGADPKQPNAEFYHGITPSFIIENLVQLYQPRRVLDSMAGMGTTGWVCSRYGIQCEQFDLYPYSDYGVEQGDAEDPPTKMDYDLVFNHPPYHNMVKYGEDPRDLSTQTLDEFWMKLRKVFTRTRELLRENGVYAVLMGDQRQERRVIPLTNKTIQIAEETGFYLYDQAIKLTSEAQSTSGLLQYRASKFQFMLPAYDTILVFKDGTK